MAKCKQCQAKVRFAVKLCLPCAEDQNRKLENFKEFIEIYKPNADSSESSSMNYYLLFETCNDRKILLLDSEVSLIAVSPWGVSFYERGIWSFLEPNLHRSWSDALLNDREVGLLRIDLGLVGSIGIEDTIDDLIKTEGAIIAR